MAPATTTTTTKVGESHPAKKGPSALRSVLAGSTAGAIEIGMHQQIPLRPPEPEYPSFENSPSELLTLPQQLLLIPPSVRHDASIPRPSLDPLARRGF